MIKTTKYHWIDYHPNEHKTIDDWMLASYSQHHEKINRFAFFNEPISKTYEHFLKNPNDMANIKTVIKVIEDETDIIGIAILHYYTDQDIYVLGINPIVVNPLFMGIGHGQKTLKELVGYAEQIIDGPVDQLLASIDANNLTSLHIFKKVGFIQKFMNEGFIELLYDMHKGSEYN